AAGELDSAYNWPDRGGRRGRRRGGGSDRCGGQQRRGRGQHAAHEPPALHSVSPCEARSNLGTWNARPSQGFWSMPSTTQASLRISGGYKSLAAWESVHLLGVC